jgi:hypothetical protein
MFKITLTLEPDALEYMAMQCHFSLLMHLKINFNLYNKRELFSRYLSIARLYLTSILVLSGLSVRG